MSVSEQLNAILTGLRSAVPEITGVIIGSNEGLPIAHSLKSGEPGRRAAMIASARTLGRRVAESFKTGTFTELTINGQQGGIYIYRAGLKGMLAITAPANANSGLIHIEARNAAAKVAEALP